MADTIKDNSEQRERFTTFIGNKDFHHLFRVPRDASLPPLRITYADYGYRDQEGGNNEAVILLCGPLNSTRYLHIAKDAVAKKHKVRIIHPDRFGFGGSTEVDAAERVGLWLEVVPLLLEHLKIKHVALMAQSAGTVYALNTLLYQRHLLHPVNPYIAIGSPWILPSHSGATASQLLKILPKPVFSNLHSLATWFHSNILPVTGFSSNIVGSVFTKKVDAGDKDVVFEEALRPLVIDMAFLENMQGLSQEALLVLKRSSNDKEWGTWVDYDRLIPMLRSADSGEKLKVDVFYAETDVLIGNSNGPKWFDDCWNVDMRGEGIEYCSRFVKGSDHDSIFDLKWGVAQEVFGEVSRRCVDGESG